LEYIQNYADAKTTVVEEIFRRAGGDAREKTCEMTKVTVPEPEMI
jgi:hypothetical protein